ncbi:RabGAP/TBC [Sistotremastrum suecicum HHB10207 ss-3]|uniref:RabGAP/TBC n=1 Tax=Sistotremastrum suecicum HHB10207 ss-3 TaxID=1314776 RepID=A0A166IMH6_9AGAM|nr:RabGAP/TBC [Sistotremastrum suecicum HHB10207 ss-3]
MLSAQSLLHPPQNKQQARASSSTDQSSIPSRSTRERSGSEATLITIYSMYGEERRSSWAPTKDVSQVLISQDSLHPHPSPSPDSGGTPISTTGQLTDADTHERPPRAQLPNDSRPLSAPEPRDSTSLEYAITSSLSLPTQSASVPASPTTPRPVLFLDKPTPPTPSPSTPISNEQPLLTEDPDSSFIRNTYAQLDVCGVKGDGYEEGIERTRARLNATMEQLRASMFATKELTNKEIDVLRTVDRYGFFSTPSSDRLLLLPTSKPLSLYTPTASTVPPTPSPLPRVPPVSVSPKESSRISKWDRMLEAPAPNRDLWTLKASKEDKLRERIYKGVPDRWRRAVWAMLISRKAGNRAPPPDKYQELIDKPSDYDIQIDLDVPRTISGHVMFRTRYGLGQRSLFHVLHSFSLKCEDCGYCQGMGPIAATLLFYMEPERTYTSLCQLHDGFNMHTIFQPGFPGLLESIYVQEKVTQRMMPGVYAAFQKHMISTTSYATKWYITLFANSVPFQTQLRLWDAFFLEGRDVLVVMAVAIVWAFKDHLLSKTASFESILSLLSSFFVPEDEDALFRWISKAMEDKKLKADMVRWRSEWTELVSQGKDAGVLL